jgi:toxin ParE1/3/4
MPRLIWAERARQDLREISGYLAQFDGRLAGRTLRAVQQSAQRLEAHPFIGPPLADVYRSLRASGTRYVLIYRADQEGVEVLRVRHEREDWRSE